MALDPLTVFVAGRDQYLPLVDAFQMVLDRSAASAVLRLQYAPAGTLPYADCLTVSVAGVVAIPTTLDVSKVTAGGAAGTAGYVLTSNGAGNPVSWQAGGSGGPHALLDGTFNNDTLAAAPTRGDLIVANATPLWARFAVGAAGTFLQGGTDPSWGKIPAISSTYFTSLDGSALTGITEAQITGLVADLALKAPLASPTFTGVPAAPTAAPGTSTTQLATTAFVAAGLAAGVVSITGTANQVIASASTGAVTLSLPQSIATSSSVQFAKVGIGVAPTRFLDVFGTTQQMRLSFDTSNFASFTVDSGGLLTIAGGTGQVFGGGTVSAPGGFVGALTGNASTVTTNANLTGPITSTGNATVIAAQTGTGTTFAMSVAPTFTGTTSVAGLTINSPTVTLSQDTNFVLSGGVNGVSFDTDVLSIDATNNRVGIGTTAPSAPLSVSFSSTNTTPWNVAGSMDFTNSSNTANNWAGLAFSDASDTIACGIATQFLDQTNHYGTLLFHSRAALGGFQEGLRITGNIVKVSGPLTLKGYTVATLPTGVQGHLAFCTDLLAPGFLVAAVGGGAVVGPVFYNGTAWVAV